MIKTCESCQYATEYLCSHEKMRGRPTYSEDERGARVFAPICEHYAEIVTEPAPIEPQAPTRIEQRTVIESNESDFDSASEDLRKEGWIPEHFTVVTKGNQILLICVFARVV